MSSSTTNPIGPSANNPAASPNSAVQSALNITPGDFLRLITTQMKDQNPLQPADPTQFLSQLEQMSQVSSMQSMQSSLTTLQTSLQSSQMANGAALIGQTVLAPTPTANLSASGGSVSGAVIAPSSAKMVTVNITSPNGALIDSFQVAPAADGLTHFTWNGTNTNGAAAAAGQYRVTATSSDGTTSTTLTPLIASKVASVIVDPSTSALDITTENGTVPLSSVVSLQ
jgi:flagellar basal-body rod modification protein FlgD